MSWKPAAPIAALALSLIVSTCAVAEESITAQWSSLVPSRIGPRALGQSAIYDPLRHRVISYDYEKGDVWELPMDREHIWRQVPYVTALFINGTGAITAYDPIHDRMLVYLPLSGEVWALAFGYPTYWSALLPVGTKPPRREGASAVFDPIHERLLIFGGLAGNPGVQTPSNELWACYTGEDQRWKPILGNDPSQGPAPRSGHASIFDPVANRMLVFGGAGGDADTWEYSFEDPAEWRQIVTPSAPAPRFGHTATYDPLQRRMLVFGGTTGTGAAIDDGWAMNLDGAPEWQSITVNEAPAGRWSHSAVFDTDDNTWIVSGGAGYGDGSMPMRDAWSLTTAGSEWTRLAPTLQQMPPWRSPIMIFDSNRGHMLAFHGAIESNAPAGLWVLPQDPTDAARLIPVEGERPPSGIRTAFDPVRDRILAIVEDGYRGLIHEVWALSLSDPAPQWTRFTPEGPAPKNSAGGTMVYDPGLDAIVTFGGNSRWWFGAQGLNPTKFSTLMYNAAVLTLSGTPTWRVIEPGGGVSTTGGFYDLAHHRVFGHEEYGNQWFQLPVDVDGPWTPVSGALTQPPLGPAFFDAQHQMVISLAPNLQTLWMMPVGEDSDWRSVSTQAPPSARGEYGIGFDTQRQRIVVFGGVGADQATLDEAWALTLIDAPTPVRLALISAEATGAGVVLIWQTTGGAFDGVVERSEANGSWGSLGSIRADAQGLIRYEDPAPPAGTRVGYRLVYAEGGVRRVSEEAWIDVPSAPRFTLEGLRPNPSPDEANVVFTLARTGDAEIALFDLQGRIVARRSLHGLVAGVNRVAIPETRTLPAAVYVIRLTQGGETRTARAVLAR